MNFFKRKNITTEEVRHETWRERHLGMRFFIIMYIGLKNLTLSKTRSFLTIGGVSLGIAMVTFLLCMGFGVQRLIVEEVTKNNPLDIIEINNGNLENFVSLDEEHVKKILSIEGVRGVERRINTGVKVSKGESQTDAVMWGANPGYLDMARVAYRSNGSKYSISENKAIVSDRLAFLLGYENPGDMIGQKINYDIVVTKELSSKVTDEKTLEKNETEVVGIIDRADSAFIYLPFDVINSAYEIDLAQTGLVSVGNMDRFDSIKGEIEQMGFITESIKDLIEDIDSFFNTMRIVLVIFGVIIMSISVMGILNTLSVSLLQRTKEIGILKALGTKRSDIFHMFIIESMIISFLGGVSGFGFGFLFSFVMNYLLITLGQKSGVELSFFVYIPWSFVTAISIFIIFLGLATGLMPAVRAAKIHALEALRYE